jgi:hypothetical protein
MIHFLLVRASSLVVRVGGTLRISILNMTPRSVPTVCQMLQRRSQSGMQMTVASQKLIIPHPCPQPIRQHLSPRMYSISAGYPHRKLQHIKLAPHPAKAPQWLCQQHWKHNSPCPHILLLYIFGSPPVPIYTTYGIIL